MTRTLTTQNAEITTATVEIKTLTVSGKQVTQAVFRQLREEPLIAENGTLNGVPWGYVNYHPDRCGDEAGHWHVIWQQGAELLRSRIEQKARFGLLVLPEASLLFAAKIADLVDTPNATLNDAAWMGDRLWRSFGYGCVPATDGPWLAGEVHGIPIYASEWLDVTLLGVHALLNRDPRVNGSEVYVTPGEPTKWANSAAERQEMVDAHLALVREQILHLFGPRSTPGMRTEETFRYIAKKVLPEADRRRRHQDQRAALADLPQLFIAV